MPDPSIGGFVWWLSDLDGDPDPLIEVHGLLELQDTLFVDRFDGFRHGGVEKDDPRYL